MSESICVVLERFAKELIYDSRNEFKVLEPIELVIKLSFDGDNFFLEEAWLDETIDFYAIADKYGFLDKLLEEALAQKLLNEKSIIAERGFIESFD